MQFLSHFGCEEDSAQGNEDHHYYAYGTEDEYDEAVVSR